jgi:hypothetical protein
MDENNNEKIEQTPVENTPVEQTTVEQTQLDNPNIEPMEIPEKKRRLRKGTIPKLLLSILLFIAGVSLIVFSLRYEEPEDNPPINETPIGDENITPINEYAGVYVYNKETNDDGSFAYDVIVLREDYTFIYDIDAGSSSAPKVGIYTVLDGVVTLEEKVSYGLDVCFFTEEDENTHLNTYTATLEEDNLTITKDETTQVFTKNAQPDGVVIYYDNTWYVPEPIDGVRPENTTQDENETWRNCNNIEN